MLTLIYCQCCQKIASYGDIQLAFFEYICERYFSGNPLTVCSKVHSGTYGYMQMAKFLEMKGFVVTTENCQDSIKVKPLGFEFFNDDLLKICCFCRRFNVE